MGGISTFVLFSLAIAPTLDCTLHPKVSFIHSYIPNQIIPCHYRAPPTSIVKYFLYTTSQVSSTGYEPGTQVAKNQSRLIIYISVFFYPFISSNSSPYLMEPFNPVSGSPIVSELASGHVVPPQLVPTAGQSRHAASTRSAMRPLVAAALRPPVPAVPVEARTRKPRFVKLITLPGVTNLITLEGK